MNRIKILLIVPIVLLFTSCSWLSGPSQTYIGTVTWVKKKNTTGAVMGYLGQQSYEYKLEIVTSEGMILQGAYDEGDVILKPGDFVRVVVEGNAFDEIRLLDREIMNSHF